MATCFKLPSLASKRKPPLQFQEFEKYKKEDRNVVVKKMKGELMETKCHFQKEAGLLSSVKGH